MTVEARPSGELRLRRPFSATAIAAVGTQLVDVQRNALDYARRDGLLAEDDAFYAERNAHVVRNAEVYYRAMFTGRVNTWNLRDQHMAETLDALLTHLGHHDDRQPARIVVWAHNSHVGDPARPRCRRTVNSRWVSSQERTTATRHA